MSEDNCLILATMLSLFLLFVCWVGPSHIESRHVVVMAGSIAWFVYIATPSKRVRLAKKLPIGEFTLAVKGDRWLPYQAIYQGSSEVVWHWGNVVEDDVWEELGYRSTDQMPMLDIVLWDKLGNADPLRFILHDIIRSDESLAVIAGKNKRLESLNFRLLVDIGRESVRLIVFPASPPSKEGALWCESGTPIWIGRRHPDGAWEKKAS